ncbi:MAG: glycosyltransferase [Lachnospiraceae bacterium]|nr:glycosyltransferase [Lachnospiraceae bacterium]
MAKANELYGKANRYLRRNGIEKTAVAVADTALSKPPKSFRYQLATTEELKAQKAWSSRFSSSIKFSLVVPAFETDIMYFDEMIASVLGQTYNNWEFIVVDGSRNRRLMDEIENMTGVVNGDRPAGRALSDEDVKSIHRLSADTDVSYDYDGCLIRYIHLTSNGGISANINKGVKVATGDYVGVLDHDDLLTPDALYYMSKALVTNEYRAKLVYSDEDKTDAKGKSFFEPNRKPNFNLDMFLTNNYICHLTFLERNLIQDLLFRPEYDGAQDYDIFLRAVKSMDDPEERILHVPKILYHWRCHANSTAGNTDAKEYAYEAGRRAVDDFCKTMGWAVTVSHTSHLGFYHIEYKNLLFTTRPELGMVCGPIYKFGKLSGGAMREDGTVLYRGLAKGMGGYMHRGSLIQQVEAGDVRNMRINPALEKLYDEMVESKLAKNAPDYVDISLAFCKKVRELGYKILYDPERKRE